MYRYPSGRKRKIWGKGQFSGGFSHAGLPQWTGNVDENTIPDTNYTSTQRTTVIPVQNSLSDVNSSLLEDAAYFGCLNTSIVGVRYYSGMVSDRELVSLQREPNNAYDCNAVRVNNVRGEQVGHIKRELAKALAPIMDNSVTRVEGLVPRGSNNVYTIPIILSFWGDIENKEMVSTALQRHGFALKSGLPVGKGGGAGSTSGFLPQPRSRSFALTSSQVKSELDSLFENLQEIDQTAEVNQSEVVTTPLFRHQRQALCWMIRRELGSELPPFWEKVILPDGKSAFKNTVTNFHTVVEPGRVKGGILADDMGLGKTLVVISLIVGNCSGNKAMFKLDKCLEQTDLKSSDFKQGEVHKKDMVFVDSIEVVLDDDDDEIGSSKPPKKAKGRPKRNTKRPSRYVNEVVEYEIPQDTASQAYQPPPKICTVSFKKVSGDGKPTLIICPLSVISNWECQIREHLHESAELNVLVYHGMSKSKGRITDQDVVITTYQTLAQEFKKSKSRGRLLATDWLRVVLDEGHVIRNPTALQSQACRSVKAERKWVLSGTPIQNSIKDLWTVVSFLGLEPFTDRSWWQRTIERPLRNGEGAAIKRIQCLMGAICMRRTKHQKVNGRPIVDLPVREVVLQKLEMSPHERVIYNKMDAATKKAIQNMIQDGTVMSRYAEVLVILLRLRQICCHPSLAKDAIDQLQTGNSLPVPEAKELVAKLIMLIGSGSVEECCVCLESLTSPVITRCAHIFCKTCISEVILNATDAARCPLCRGPLKESELTEVPPDAGAADEVKGDDAMVPSSKVGALMNELLALRDSEPGVRSLVVSQFTSFLRIIAKHLAAKGLSCVFFHGGMTSVQRNEALETFQRGEATVMLLSLKSGGVGLNLTAASRVFLMEPAWNPAAEEQCFDRVHRLGQTKPVKIMKFVCAGSVEERITDAQSVKRNIAEKSLLRMTKSEERQQRRMEDLRSLMDI